MRVTRRAILAVLGLVAASAVGAAAGELRSTAKREKKEGKIESSRALAVRDSKGRRVLSKDHLEMVEGMENLQQQFRELNGRDFTKEELREAIERAHTEAGVRGEEGFPTNRHLFVQDMPESERRRRLREHDERQEDKANRRMQTIRKADGFIVTAASPGFRWNAGRNTFWCAAVHKVDRNQRNTRRRQKITLKNCYTTSADELIMRYTDDLELWMKRIDTVFYEFCLETDKVRRNQAIRLDYCDVYDENQVFELRGTDDSWRPTVDTSLCVTCNNKDCERGGGKLKYKPCSSDLVGNNKYRGGQAFIYCFLGTSCSVDNNFNRIDCRIEERCGDKR